MNFKKIMGNGFQNRFSLKNRIFALFIIYTFSLFFFVILIESYIFKEIILQFEDSILNNYLTELRTVQKDFESRTDITLEEISRDTMLLSAVQNFDYNKTEEILDKYQEQNKSGVLYLFNKGYEWCYGEEWELLEKYISNIVSNGMNNLSGNFFLNLEKQPFFLSYIPLFSNETGRYIGVLISLKPVFYQELMESGKKVYSFATPVNPEFILTHEPDNENSKIIFEKIKAMISLRMSESIIRSGKHVAVGILINYDNLSQASSINIITHERKFFQFYKQNIFLIFLITVIGVSVGIMIIGFWLSKSVVEPISDIRNKIANMGEKPTEISLIENKYPLELEEMVNTFNKMSSSLAKHEEYLREFKIVADNLDPGFFGLDDDFRIEENKNKLINQPISKFFKIDYSYLKKAIEEKVTLPPIEISLSENRKYIVHNIRHVDEGERLHLIGSITDITQIMRDKEARTSLELELIKSNKLAQIGYRVEGIVHNINSPLNSIFGFAQFLKRSIGENDDLEKILSNAGSISRMMKSLLQKIKEDDISMRRLVNINSVVKQELEQLEHNIYFKHHITLETEFCKESWEIDAVFGDISQCVTNILNNAVDSMKESDNKYLWVKTFSRDNLVGVEISDTGEGIKDENRGKIFEPSFTTKKDKKGGGFGLGLAITKNIVERYSGNIAVASNLNMGTTFTLTFPIMKNSDKQDE